jgi:cytochrome b561
MLRRIPSGAGFFDYAHVTIGFVALALSVSYPLACIKATGWRLYFPWLAGNMGGVGRDLAGLTRGTIPTAEGGGLFAMIEGLLLLALFITAVTGAAWFALQGTGTALAVRDFHIIAARGFAGLIVLHLLAVASHLLDFVR